jgi:hypothetical protein
VGVPLVLRAFVLSGRPGCTPTREAETEGRRRVHLAGGSGVVAGGSLMGVVLVFWANGGSILNKLLGG